MYHPLTNCRFIMVWINLTSITSSLSNRYFQETPHRHLTYPYQKCPGFSFTCRTDWLSLYLLVRATPETPQRGVLSGSFCWLETHAGGVGSYPHTHPFTQPAPGRVRGSGFLRPRMHAQFSANLIQSRFPSI